MTYFHEDQHFRQSWLWVVIAVPIVVAAVSLAATPQMSGTAVVVTLAVGVLVTALFAFARLETTVSSDAVVVAFHGLWPTRRIPLTEIASFAPMRYTIWDSGGWGVHLGLAGMSYNVSGNKGVRFVLNDGGRVLVGTQRPDAFAAAVAKAVAARG